MVKNAFALLWTCGAIIASESPQTPTHMASLQAAIGADERYSGTGWIDTGGRRPAAPVQFILHTAEHGGSQRVIEVWRAESGIPHGEFALGGPSTQLIYMLPGADGVHRYISRDGHIRFEALPDGRLAGSFEATVELHAICRSASGATRCDLTEGGPRLTLAGEFHASDG
jgi:hypothetical protein